jgi:hypothetical protein
MRKPKLRIKIVKFCGISGDPGCLGYPEWHNEDCDYIDVECLFCECGGHNVYGEMSHNEGCYYFTNPNEHQFIHPIDNLRSWFRNFKFPKLLSSWFRNFKFPKLLRKQYDDDVPF